MDLYNLFDNSVCQAWSESKLFDTDGIPETTFWKNWLPVLKNKQTTKKHSKSTSRQRVKEYLSVELGYDE